jgi:hypothetical protein
MEERHYLHDTVHQQLTCLPKSCITHTLSPNRFSDYVPHSFTAPWVCEKLPGLIERRLLLYIVPSPSHTDSQYSILWDHTNRRALKPVSDVSQDICMDCQACTCTCTCIHVVAIRKNAHMRVSIFIGSMQRDEADTWQLDRFWLRHPSHVSHDPIVTFHPLYGKRGTQIIWYCWISLGQIRSGVVKGCAPLITEDH